MPEDRDLARLAVVSYPQDRLGVRLLDRFLRIFSALDLKSALIAESRSFGHTRVWQVKFPRRSGVLLHVLFQIRIALILLRNRRSWDVVCLLVGGTAMVIPILLTRLAGKKAVLVLAGSSVKTETRKSTTNHMKRTLLVFAEALTLIFSSFVVAYGKSAVAHMDVERWRSNILTEGAEYVDLDVYSQQRPISQRPMTVGFVGRLSPEKGILNFLEALRYVAREYPCLEAHIVGDGTLREVVRQKARTHELGDRLKILGWAEQSLLPRLYGEMRFLVIPSYTEGLPNVMLEAMACGTLVLATKVGAIPDVIRHGINGFLANDNSPHALAMALRGLLAMDLADLDSIAQQARSTIVDSYDFQSAVNRYHAIFATI